MRENIAGYEKAKVIGEAIEAKDGKTETEDIGELHDEGEGWGLTLMGTRLFMSMPMCEAWREILIMYTVRPYRRRSMFT